ncbi:hypothetical protein AB833_20200 [Chromatiales bacterium (ex Bugula neritina AB1)]|nr:hypothetical protein AB833_20200 [Chromatiales bacterium (ex Bugula neritina AB1)]
MRASNIENRCRHSGRRDLLTLITAFFVLLSSAAFAGDNSDSSTVKVQSEISSAREGRDWIEKMSSAMQNLTYSGTFVYIHDREVESMRIFHSRMNGVEHERLVSLNGEAREIIRNADSVVCIWPGTKSVIVSKSQPRTPFPKFDPEQLSELESLYRFSSIGRARVAGRQAEVIDITPLDSYRYGYRLWVDLENFLLLRSAMSDSSGDLVEQVMFTEVRFPESMPLEVFSASTKGREHKWMADNESGNGSAMTLDLAPVTGIPGILEMVLPDGFAQVSDKVTPVAGTDFAVRRLMYSDGLASLSVFIVDARDESAGGILHGASSMGAVHAYGIMRDNWHATVVGEVPLATVKMLGESILLATQ